MWQIKNKTKQKIKNQKKKEIALNHSLDIDFKGFRRIYKKYTVEPNLFNDATLPSDNQLRSRKNFWDNYIVNHNYWWSD